MTNKNQQYKIIRYYSKEGKLPKEITRGLTLEEAQTHCRQPDTSKYGKWFDGYTKQ